MTSPFLCGHATHPDPLAALALVAAQLDGQRAQRPAFRPTLGLLYLTDHCAGRAEELLADAQARWPGLQLVGTVGYGIAVSGVEYVDEPALALMLCDLPTEQFQVFNGRQPLADDLAWTALVHADPGTPDLAELIGELAQRTGGRYLFGGLSSGRSRPLQLANGVFQGGLSGVGFGPEVPLLSRVTQGCLPVGPTRRVTGAERNLVLSLDGEPALQALLQDLDLSLDPPSPALAQLRSTLVGLTDAGDVAAGRGGQFGPDTRVRHLVGLDPARGAVAVGDWVSPTMQLGFCQRNVDAARRDLIRICTEIRAELEDSDDADPTSVLPGDLPAGSGAAAMPGAPPTPAGTAGRRVAGALYVSCTGRGGAHFGAPSAELQLVQQALGEVPLVGFFAAGEIARHHLYGYTGVLTVWLCS